MVCLGECAMYTDMCMLSCWVYCSADVHWVKGVVNVSVVSSLMFLFSSVNC